MVMNTEINLSTVKNLKWHKVYEHEHRNKYVDRQKNKMAQIEYL